MDQPFDDRDRTNAEFANHVNRGKVEAFEALAMMMMMMILVVTSLMMMVASLR